MSQHMDALALANRIRLARAAVKADLRNGEITFAHALDAPCTANMPIAELMMAARRFGRSRTFKTLTRLQISEHRRVRDLTPRQRRLLTSVVASGKIPMPVDPWRVAA